MSSEEAGTPQVFIGQTPGSVYAVVGEDFLANVFDIDGEQFLDGGVDAHSLSFLKKFKNSTGFFISAPTAMNLTSAVELSNVPIIANLKSGQLKTLAPGGNIYGVRTPLFNSKYEPYVIYKTLSKGELSLYILAGDEKDAEKLGRAAGNEEELKKVAAEHGTVAILVWKPIATPKPILRSLLPGTCSFDRIQKALDRAAKCLPFLNGPLVKTGERPLSAPTSASSSRPSSKQLSRPAASRQATAASPTTRPVPARTARPVQAVKPTRAAAVQPARVAAVQPARAAAVQPARAIVAPTRAAVPTRPLRPTVTRIEPRARPTTATSRPAARVPTRPLNNATSRRPTTSAAAPPRRPAASVTSVAPTVVNPPVVITSTADDSVIIIDQIRNEVVVPPAPEPTAIAHEEEPVEQPQVVEEPKHEQPRGQHEPQVQEEQQVQEELQQRDQGIVQEIENVSTSENESSFTTSETKNQSLVDIGEDRGTTNSEPAPKVPTEILASDDSTFASETSNAQDQDTTNNSVAEPSEPVVASQEDPVLSQPGDITDLANKLGDIALDSTLPFVNAISGIIAAETDSVPVQSNGTSVGENPIVENGNHETPKHELMQERSTILSIGNKSEPEYEISDPLIDGILDACATESDKVDQQQQQSISLIESEPLEMVKEEAVIYKGPKVARPYYFDFVSLPRNEKLETTLGKLEMREFVEKIRARHYILASKNVDEDVLDSIHYGFKLWENSNLKCSIHPTHHNSAIGQFKAKHNDESAVFEVCLPISNSILRDETGEEYKVARIALRDEFD